MKTTTSIAVCLATLMAGQIVHATTITIGGSAPSGAVSVDFNDLTLGLLPPPQTAVGPTGTVGVTGTPDARVADDSVSGQYAMPIAATGKYLTSGNYTSPGGSITLDLLGDATYLGLLWGSVDSYNTLEFYNSAHTLLASVSGTDVINHYGLTEGSQTTAGEAYVDLTSDTPFRFVRMVSTQYAFEFDNLSHNAPDGGSTMALMGIGLMSFAALRRKLNRA